jgi:diguanylate cyclase (GGDEF)-like protein
MSTADFERELLEMQDRYRDGCADRMAEIDRLAGRWLDGSDATAGAQLVRALHRLAGSAGTFGFSDIGSAASAAEVHVRARVTGAPRPEPVPPRVALAALRAAIERATTVPRAETIALASPADHDLRVSGGGVPRKTDHRPVVQFLTETTEGRYGFALREAGFRTEAANAGSKSAPFALVATQRELERAPEPAARVRVALLPSESFHDRLAAARAGAGTVLVEPVDEETLVEALEDLRGGASRRPPRLVVVDDDAAVAEELARILELEGMESICVTDPTEVLDVVREHRPDVLLTDLHMPHCDGFELATIVRQDPSLIFLPVVFMSADGREIMQRKARRHDGDAFVLKHEPLDAFVDLIRTKTRRGRALEASMTTDSMTGLLRHAVFKDRLDTEVGRCRRQDETLACVMLDIDHFKNINDRHGHATGDRVIQGLARLLRRRFRATDLVGRYGGEEFALAILQTSAERAHDLVDDLRRRFAGLTFATPSGTVTATFSAGIATYPACDSRDELLVAADEALYAAKQAGRDQVRVYDPPSGRAAGDRVAS